VTVCPPSSVTLRTLPLTLKSLMKESVKSMTSPSGGLDDVALVDRVADVKRDGDGVADDGDVADDLLDLADGVGWCGRLCLRVLPRRGRPGEEIDDVGRKTGAVRRYQSRVFLAGKVARDEVMAAVGVGDDEVGTRALVVPAKQ
jgi:hypothetical protein